MKNEKVISAPAIIEKRRATMDASCIHIKPYSKVNDKKVRWEWMQKQMDKYRITLLLLAVLNTNCEASIQPCVLTTDVCVAIIHPSVLTSDVCVVLTHPCVLTADSFVASTHPCVLTPDVCVALTHPCVFTPDVCVASTHPCVLTPDGCIVLTHPCIPSTDICVVQTEGCCLVSEKVRSMNINTITRIETAVTTKYGIVSSTISQRFKLPLPQV